MSSDLTGNSKLESLIDPPTKTRLLYPRRVGDAGLDPATMQVLIAIKLLGPASVGAIADRLALNSPTVSVALAVLRNHRLVTEAAAADRRRRLHRTTRGGDRRIREFARRAEEKRQHQ